MHRFSIAPRESLARTAIASSVLAAVFAASLLGPTGLSHAQPKGAVGAGSASVAASAKPVSDANRKEAAERFKRGVQLQSDGNLDAAVIEFERAYELAPAYQVLYNIAVVYRDKSDRASALRAFERFLNEGKDAIDAKRRKDVEGEIAKLREVVAMINIKSSVAGADVTLDDQPLGKTPLAQALMVNVGRHKIEATKDGFRGDTQFVTLAGKDNRTVELNLKEIKADPPPPATTTAPPPVTATTSAPPPTTTAKLTTEGSGNKGLGYGLSIAGVLGLGMGTFFGLRASSQWGDVEDSKKCPQNKCTDEAIYQKSKDAKSNANISTLGFGLGGAALVAGVVLILTSSSSNDSQAKLKLAPNIGHREGGMLLQGGFLVVLPVCKPQQSSPSPRAMPLSKPPAPDTTLVHILQNWAQATPDRICCTFLGEHGEEVGALTCAELDEKARYTASWLQEMGLAGERVLLLLQPSLEYLVAYLGCLYAGAIAVPGYPPDPSRLERSLPRVQAIVNGASVQAAFVDAALLAQRERIGQLIPELDRITWMQATLDVPAGPWSMPDITGSSLAFLQYTSGSTGTPKGVKISHGNLVHNVWAMQQRMSQGPDNRMVSWVPPYHDMGLVVGILLPLYAGFPTYLLSPATFVRSPYRWLEAISRYRATTSCAPNFAFELALRKLTREQHKTLDLSSWTLALNGAEPVRAQTIKAFSEVFGPCGFRTETFYPAFGMSDATAMVSGGPLLRAPIVFQADPDALRSGVAKNNPSPLSRPLVSCGPVIDGQQALIVDPATRKELPEGQVGEIWLHGPCVGHGYWDRPEDTSAVFEASLSDDDGRKFLRTGDLGFLSDRELFLTGRLKDLIIIRGKNHYPQDIESTVQAAHPSLRPGCGIAFSIDVQDEERLVLVQELDERSVNNPGDALDTALRAIVTEHELFPYALLLVPPGSIPKTSSGKLQRGACREMFLNGAFKIIQEHRAEIAARQHPLSTKNLRPSSERERILAMPAEQQPRLLRLALLGHISLVLHIDPLQIEANRPLSSLGFDSLTAIELKNRLEIVYNVSLPVSSLIRGPTLIELGELILGQIHGGAPSVDEPQSEQQSAEFPLSYGQQALWFLYQLAPESAAYNVVLPLQIRGPLDIERLRESFQVLVNRHPSLRTTFSSSQGLPFQSVSPQADVQFEAIDARGWPAPTVHDYITRECHRPFDLGVGGPFRVCLLRCNNDLHQLLISAHHIIIDFWSMGIIFHELGLLYGAEGSPEHARLPLPKVDYSQYVAWQQRLLSGPGGEKQWSYWRQYLTGELPVLEMPTDFPRPATQTFRGAAQSFTLKAEQTATLKAVAAQHHVSPFVLLLSAFQLFIHQLTGQYEFLLGTLTAGRSRADFADLVGYFVNPVVVRATFQDEPFTTLLDRVKSDILGALENQDFPFSRLVEKLLVTRDPSRSPLFQALFVLQRAPTLDGRELTPFALQDSGAHTRMGDLDIESISVGQRVARFDLTLTMADGPHGMAGSMEFNADLFEAATIERMVDRFVFLLDEIATSSQRRTAELTLLPASERALLRHYWLSSQRSFEPRCVHHLVEAQAQAFPERIAMIFEEQSLTFRQLDEASNQLAHALLALGVTRGSLVGLCADRGFDLAIGLLGILKAGGAYIPLDPAYPRDRLSFMLSDSGAQHLVIQESQASLLSSFEGHTLTLDHAGARLASFPRTRPEQEVTPDDLCYVLYTSGSTGLPKGVQIEHRSVSNFLASMAETPGLKREDVLLSVTSPSFDIFGLEFFLPLCNGARLIMASKSATVDGARLDALIAAHGVTLMQATPSTWQLWVEASRSSNPSLRALCGGEPLPPALAASLLERVGQLWNMYGPTETTIWSTCQQVLDPRKISLGQPIANTSVYVLDEHLNPVPLGSFGECFIGGAGLARGYLHRDKLTQERFLPDPFAGQEGARMYRTGDRVRQLGNGEFEFAGRTDFQVKIRGYRIELGEIETRLREFPAISQAVVHVQELSPENKQLVGYYVPLTGLSVQSRALQDFLRVKLPDHMVPRYLVELDKLPLTPNGKINRKALPVPAMSIDSEAPLSRQGMTELRLRRVWATLLGVTSLSGTDDFFELGGHSLLVMRLIALCKKEFGVDCPVAVIFNNSTLREMTNAIDKLRHNQLDETAKGAWSLDVDIVLDENIQAAGCTAPTSGDVFFTGGTGFLGAFLLRQLLDRQSATVHCLVRAPDAAAAVLRLRRNLERFDLWRDEDASRLVGVPGDLALPSLGLSPSQYEKIANGTGWILHNGAVVDFVRPYNQLRTANVTGTGEIFRLATTGCLKPVHFVSTVSVFPPTQQQPRPLESEQSTLEFDGSRIHGGYAQSKWVSDRIALLARARGIPISIYRPGSILGASTTGHGNVDDIFHIIIKGCIQLGMVPDVDMWANFTPTDFVAPAIVALALENQLLGGTFHLVNPIPVPWTALCAAMSNAGYRVREVPYDQWVAAIEAAAHAGDDVSLVRVLPFFQVPRDTFRLPWFDDTNARAALSPLGVSCSPADDKFLATWLLHLIRSGFLPPPP